MSSSRRLSSTPVPPGVGSSSVDFILRTAMERQSSNKRPIRPKIVDDTLLGDDSDDSDFNVDEQEQWSGSGSDVSEDSNSSDASTEVGKMNSDSEDEEASKNSSTLRETLKKLINDNKDFHPPGNLKPKKKQQKKGKAAENKKLPKKYVRSPKSKKVDKMLSSGDERKKADLNSSSVTPGIMARVFKASCAIRDIRSDIDLKKKICSFCLGEKSDGSNEIVECDSCKITVHEGCYGMSDSQSLSSGSGSSSSTEPWFCDYCKNPDSRCICALCPNPGGLLKATADEQFVHLTCAHYTPSVISAIDNKANIGRMSYTKWGNKPCSLCTSIRFANTGITVKCDAGMCKSYVHVSCAQKFGLLSDPNLYGVHDEADPYFASCRLHGLKDQAKHRATLYKVLQEQVRIKRAKTSTHLTPAARQSQGRILEKLQKIRAKVAAKHMNSNSDGNALVASSVSGHKLPFRRLCVMSPKRKPRNLKSCAYSVSRFLQKIENMGEDITSLELEERNERIVANIKKRWNVLPSLTVEFAAYYFDREARIESLSKQCQELIKQNENLNDKQIALNTVLENEAVDHMEIMDETMTMDTNLQDLKGILKSFSPGNKTINNIKGLPPRPKSYIRKPPIQVRGVQRAKTAVGGLELKNKTPSRVSLSNLTERLTLHMCATCKKSDQQHLITKCDHCNMNYHLGCLDPPLTRMPRRSRLCGWMCSDCCDEESEKEEVVAIDTDAPRTLRGRTNIKRPEKYREDEDSEDEVVILKEKAAPKPSTKTSLKPAAMLTQRPVPALNIIPLHVLRDQMHVKMGTFQNSPLKTIPRILKRKGENNLRPKSSSSVVPAVAHNYLPPPLKKQKISPSSNKPSPILPKRYVPILPKPIIKQEKPTPKKMSSLPLTKGTKASPKAAKIIPIPPIINLVSPEMDHTDIYEIPAPQTQNASPVSKNLKIVLSPVNSDHGTMKNGIIDSRSTHITPTTTSSSVAQGKKGKIPSPNLNSAVSAEPPKKPSRKIKSKTIKSPDKDKNYFNSLNMSGQIAVAINYNNYAGMSGVSGKCSVCNKVEDKKNLVMCDDCTLEFHFTCVPPFVPYNPKRRGYKWVCERCANSSDEGSCIIGEIRENVSLKKIST